MARPLAFLHTSPVHIQTFDTLLAELAPTVPAYHVVDEMLLRDARTLGGVTPELRVRVEDVLLQTVREQDAPVMVCTCSSIGAVAEGVGLRTSARLLRIDRAMAEEAVALGTRIVVAATLATTLIPTRELILAVARAAGRTVQVTDLLCEAAWQQFEQGNQDAYLHEVAASVQSAATTADVIVLAQASMARAVEQCRALSVPVLTSPRSGLLSAIKAYREHCEEIW